VHHVGHLPRIISHHVVLFLTILFNIMLPWCLRQPYYQFYSFTRQSPKQYMYFLSHLPAPHASPHKDKSVNYFVLINTNN